MSKRRQRRKKRKTAELDPKSENGQFKNRPISLLNINAKISKY